MLLLTLALLQTPLPCGLEASERLDLVQSHLTLEVALDYEAGRIDGRAQLRVASRADGVRCIPLQVGRLMTVDALTVRGEAVEFTQDVVTFIDWPEYQVNQVWATLPEPLATGESVDVSIEYGGFLVPYTESGMRYVQDHIGDAFTILRSEARAFPVLATPSWRINREAPDGDFTYRLDVTVPAGQVVAGPVAARRTPVGQAERWELTGADPVPFLNVPIARYDTLHSKETRLFHFPEDRAGAERLQRAVQEAGGRLRAWFGPPRDDRPVTIMEIPESYGSQASATAGILQTADAFREASSLPALFHELSHLWHPMDTGRPPDRWNEGLATFLQYRLASELTGDSLTAAMSRIRERARRQIVDQPALREIPLASYGEERLTDYAYTTGCLLFYVLYETLGAERFDRVLGSYFQEFKARGTDTDGFVSWVRRIEPDLATVMEDWMYSAKWVERVEREGPVELLAAEYKP